MSEAASTPHQIACMEVWGGNGPARTPITMPGNDVFVACEPWNGDRAGGDIYSMSNCVAGNITRFVLADIAGHGEASDELAVSLRRLMRKHINTADQTALARALNREFGELSTTGRFATALIATYFAPTDHLIVCSAGHPPPLWYRAAERRWVLLSAEVVAGAAATSAEQIGVPNLPLGILDPINYEQFAVPLGAGDVVVMYTDALMEAGGVDGAQLGTRGLLALCDGLEEHTPERIAEGLLSRVKGATGGAPLDDDATVLVLRHTAQDPPRQTVVERARALGRMIGLV